MKRWILTLMLPLLLMGGCQYSSAERVVMLNEQMHKLDEVSEAVDARMDDLTAFIDESRVILNDPNLDPDVAETVKDAIGVSTARISVLLEQKVKADALLDKFGAKLEALANQGEITIFDELGLYGEGIAEFGGVIPEPFGSYVILAGSVLGLLGGKKYLNVAKEGAADKNALADVVASVTTLINGGDGDRVDSSDAIRVLKKSQTRETRARVRDLL